MGSSVSLSTSRTSGTASQHFLCLQFCGRSQRRAALVAAARRKILIASRRFSHVPRSVISANVRLALRCKSIFSEKTSVLRARRGSPEKKSVSPRCKESELRSTPWTQETGD